MQIQVEQLIWPTAKVVLKAIRYLELLTNYDLFVDGVRITSELEIIGLGIELLKFIGGFIRNN